MELKYTHQPLMGHQRSNSRNQLGMGQQLSMSPGMGGMHMGGDGMGMGVVPYGYSHGPSHGHNHHGQYAQYDRFRSQPSPTSHLTAHHSPISQSPQAQATYGDDSHRITDVWADQLEKAFETIRKTVVDYPYVAMDTEFPGVVARPVGNFKNNADYYYQTLRCNVNLLKIIQLGITFANEQGEHPPDGPCTWQFNFKFNLEEDIYAQESIELLEKSGIDFARFERDGIEVQTFAELLMSSGLVLCSEPPVKWLSFHSGYDFGYLIKVLTSKDLPTKEDEFFELMATYFPEVYDVKYLLKQTKISEMCGLNKLGDELDVPRIGPAHQAGSDSLLTAHCFFKLNGAFFPDQSVSNHKGVLFGLGLDKSTEVNQQQQNGLNPSITPSTPGGGTPQGSAAGLFPSTPTVPQRGPQVGQYNSLR